MSLRFLMISVAAILFLASCEEDFSFSMAPMDHTPTAKPVHDRNDGNDHDHAY